MKLSYSNLHDYETCPRRFHHKHILRDLPQAEPTAEMLRGSAVHEAIQDRFHGKPLPEGMPYEDLIEAIQTERGDRTLFCEHKLGMKQDGQACDFYHDNVYLRGVIDLCITDYKSAWIGDWKTGKVREDPTELKIHAVLLKAAFPSLSIITGNYIWLQHCRVGQLWNLSNTEVVWQWVKTLGRHIEDRLSAGTREAWPPNKGPLCGWCPVPKEKCEYAR